MFAIRQRLTGLILITVSAALTSCATVSKPVVPPPPLLPLAASEWTPDDALEFSRACFTMQDPINQSDPIAELLLNFNNGARDFRAPAGPDGYILQVVPLNHEFKSLPLTGHLTFILFAESARKQDGAISQPLNIWRISEQDLPKYWMPTQLLESYIFHLDWGDFKPAPGNYELVVHVVCQDGVRVINICRALSFHEKLGVKGI